LEHNVSHSAWIISARIVSVPGGLYAYTFSVTILTLAELGSGTNGLAVCISFYLTLTLCMFNII